MKKTSVDWRKLLANFMMAVAPCVLFFSSAVITTFGLPFTALIGNVCF